MEVLEKNEALRRKLQVAGFSKRPEACNPDLP
jgi:hypothetical protein